MLCITNLNEIPHFVRNDNNSYCQVGEKVRPPEAVALFRPNTTQKLCHSERSEESKIAEKLFCITSDIKKKARHCLCQA